MKHKCDIWTQTSIEIWHGGHYNFVQSSWAISITSNTEHVIHINIIILFCFGIGFLKHPFQQILGLIRTVPACNRGYDNHFIVMFCWNITPQTQSYDIPPVTSFWQWVVELNYPLYVEHLTWPGIEPVTSQTQSECSTTRSSGWFNTVLTLVVSSQPMITPLYFHRLCLITWPILYLTAGGRGLLGSWEPLRKQEFMATVKLNYVIHLLINKLCMISLGKIYVCCL